MPLASHVFPHDDGKTQRTLAQATSRELGMTLISLHMPPDMISVSHPIPSGQKYQMGDGRRMRPRDAEPATASPFRGNVDLGSTTRRAPQI